MVKRRRSGANTKLAARARSSGASVRARRGTSSSPPPSRSARQRWTSPARNVRTGGGALQAVSGSGGAVEGIGVTGALGEHRAGDQLGVARDDRVVIAGHADDLD